jgi:hypothetical protein
MEDTRRLPTTSHILLLFVSSFQVVVFAATWCPPYCDQSKALLNSLKLTKSDAKMFDLDLMSNGHANQRYEPFLVFGSKDVFLEATMNPNKHGEMDICQNLYNMFRRKTRRHHIGRRYL